MNDGHGAGADAARLPALLAVLQLGDGLFPAGGFAHSFGLETYAQAGTVRSRRGLEAFLVAHLEGSSGPADAVAAALCARAAGAADAATCAAVDARLEAMKWVPELAAASRQMGRQTARAARAFGADVFLDELARAIDAEGTPGHHAAVFGAVAGRSGVDPEMAAGAYLYSTASLLVSAALRLIPLGQVEGQAALASLRPRIARLAAAAARSGLDDIWAFGPGLELASLRHTGLPMRLFRS
jgi:urease accessory protein